MNKIMFQCNNIPRNPFSSHISARKPNIDETNMIIYYSAITAPIVTGT